jgi:hypothetical protein
VIPTDGATAKLLGVITMALSTMGYSVSRGMAKKSLPLIFFCMGLAGFMLSGCSTPVRTAYVAEASVIASADQAWQGWFDYVVAGKSTVAQYEQSKALYIKYQCAKELAVQALQSYSASSVKNRAPLDTAAAMLADTSAELIAFIKACRQ